jgi:hypothetical protein
MRMTIRPLATRNTAVTRAMFDIRQVARASTHAETVEVLVRLQHELNSKRDDSTGWPTLLAARRPASSRYGGGVLSTLTPPAPFQESEPMPSMLGTRTSFIAHLFALDGSILLQNVSGVQQVSTIDGQVRGSFDAPTRQEARRLLERDLQLKLGMRTMAILVTGVAGCAVYFLGRETA